MWVRSRKTWTIWWKSVVRWWTIVLMVSKKLISWWLIIEPGPSTVTLPWGKSRERMPQRVDRVLLVGRLSQVLTLEQGVGAKTRQPPDSSWRIGKKLIRELFRKKLNWCTLLVDCFALFFGSAILFFWLLVCVGFVPCLS